MSKSDDVSVREFLAHPIATIGAAVSFVGGVTFGGLEPLLATVWSQAGALFAVFSVGSGTLAGRFEWLPKSTLAALAIGAGLLFVANRLWAVAQRYCKETRQ